VLNIWKSRNFVVPLHRFENYVSFLMRFKGFERARKRSLFFMPSLAFSQPNLSKLQSTIPKSALRKIREK